MLQRRLHDAHAAVAVLGRRGDVERVGAHAVADELGVDRRAAPPGVLELLEDHDAAPSPMTKPSRSLSNGRLARCGSSLRVDSARIAAKPPTPIGVIAASEPPAIITSASSRWMISKASPMACADAEQAVQVAEFGPLAPKRIETWPAARLMMAAGMKNGEIRRGPPSMQRLVLALDGAEPADADAMNTPTRVAISGVTVSAGVVHRELRRGDRVLDEDVHLLDVFLVDELQRVEALDLARDPRGELRGVELRDRSDPALAGAERLPVRLGPDAERRHEADARHDDSPAQSASVRVVTSSCCAIRCTRSLPSRA